MRRRPFKPMLLAFPLLLLAGIAIGGDRGDRVELRFDNRGDRIDNASIRRGEHFDRRCDRRH